jgi:hypothetical protein
VVTHNEPRKAKPNGETAVARQSDLPDPTIGFDYISYVLSSPLKIVAL